MQTIIVPTWFSLLFPRIPSTPFRSTDDLLNGLGSMQLQTMHEQKNQRKKKVDRQIVVLKYCKTTDDGDYEIRPQQSSLSDVTLVA